MHATDITLFLNSMVVGIDSGESAVDTAVHTVTLMSPAGMLQLTGHAIVLAMGCRERTRSEIKIPGSRPAGVFTAGWRSDTSISKISSPARALSSWARATSG